MQTDKVHAPSPSCIAHSMSGLFAAWLADRAECAANRPLERKLGPETAHVYREMWRALTAHCAQRNLRFDALTVDDLETYLNSRSVRLRPNRAPCSPAGASLSPRYARRLLRLIDWLAEFDAERLGRPANRSAQELLQRSAYRYADTSDKDPMPDHLVRQDALRLRSYLASPTRADGWKELRDRTAVALMLGAGLAPGDVRGLRVEGVNRGGDAASMNAWSLSLPGNGNSPAREAPLADWAAALLAKWMQVREQRSIAGHFMFPSTQSGRQWSHTRCYESCKQVLVEAGLESERGLYKLRHTYALDHLSSGRTDAEVARWLGLLDKSAMSRYRRLLEETVDAR